MEAAVCWLKTYPPANEDSQTSTDWAKHPTAKELVPLLSGYRFFHIIYTSIDASTNMGYYTVSGQKEPCPGKEPAGNKENGPTQ